MSYVWVLMLGKTCTDCGYGLHGLPVTDEKTTCPECGTVCESHFQDRSDRLTPQRQAENDDLASSIVGPVEAMRIKSERMKTHGY